MHDPAHGVVHAATCFTSEAFPSCHRCGAVHFSPIRAAIELAGLDDYEPVPDEPWTQGDHRIFSDEVPHIGAMFHPGGRIPHCGR